MSVDDSETLTRLVDANDVNRDEVRGILQRYFDQNQDAIWRDALVQNELLKR